jgi:hypothetical protein
MKYGRIVQKSWQFHNFHCENVAIKFFFFPKEFPWPCCLGHKKRKLKMANSFFRPKINSLLNHCFFLWQYFVTWWKNK